MRRTAKPPSDDALAFLEDRHFVLNPAESKHFFCLCRQSMSRRLAAIASASFKSLILRSKSLKSVHLCIHSSRREEDSSSLLKLEPSSATVKDFAFLHETPKLESCSSACVSAEALLFVKAIRAARREFTDETEKFLRRFRDMLSASLVVEVIQIVKVPELCIGFFTWAGRQIGYSHSSQVYEAMAEVLGLCEESKVLEGLLREIGEDDKEVLGQLLNILVQRCSRNGHWNAALEEIGRLKSFGYRPSRITYNTLIQVLLSAERLDTAYLVHKEMSESGFSMDRFTMGCFAFSLCTYGKWKEAVDLARKEDFQLDTILCTKMISGLMEVSLFEEALSFLHLMRSNSFIPNDVTYRTLLSGFIKKKELGWCKRIISMMINEGCSPSISLLNSLVHAYSNSGDHNYAYKLLKKMGASDCPPGYVAYNILIGSICCRDEQLSSDLLDLAEKAYEDMICAGFVLNKVNTANFARCLCAAEKFDKAIYIIKEMMRKGFVPDASTYSKVIGFLCQACKFEKAFDLFEEMKRSGVVPDVYTYTILIDFFCKVGLVKQARNWFDEMVRNGCAPNVVTHTSLIHAYLKNKQLSSANEIFERMISAGCPPNVITYTALIDGLCKAGESQKACNIFARLVGNSSTADSDSNVYFRGDGADDVEPNIITYGALVDGLCKAHKVVEARDLLDAMSLAGFEPNHVVYDALVDGFCKAGKLEDAQEILTKMTNCGYTPTVYTYSSLIDRMFKDNRLDLALKFLSKMLENSCCPNVITYTEMIDGLCKAGKTDDALKVLNVMEEKGCAPNVVTYTALIDGFGKASNVGICLDLFNQMSMKGCAPNFITYKVLINHCCTTGLLDTAHQLLVEMNQTCWPKHVADYCKVIQGFSKKYIASLGLLEEVMSYSSKPIASTYCILIDSFLKAGELQKALELHKEMVEIPAYPDFVSYKLYSSLIHGLCLGSMVEKAFELYSEMIRMHLVPEFGLLVCLIRGLLRVNKWAEVLELSYSISCQGVIWKDCKSLDRG